MDFKFFLKTGIGADPGRKVVLVDKFFCTLIKFFKSNARFQDDLWRYLDQ